MKTHQYLTNGVLEAYLLGVASDKEKGELEDLLTTDPELVTQLNELEVDLEQYFLRQAVPPPPHVREALLQRINETEVQRWEAPERTYARTPRPQPEPTKPDYVDVTVNDTHIRVHKNWRAAFIMVFILSKVFLILGLYYYFKADSQAEEIQRLKAAAQQTAPVPRSATP